MNNSPTVLRTASGIIRDTTTGQVTSATHVNQFITAPDGVTPITWCSATVHNMWGNTAVLANATRANAPTHADSGASGWFFPAHSPCPPGWRVPTRWEWGDMLGGAANTDGVHLTGAAGATLGTVNQWQWRNADPLNGSARGVGGRIMTRTDSQAQVFLPAGGLRNRHNGDIRPPGVGGWFWSSTPFGTNTARLLWVNNNTDVSAGVHDDQRAWGLFVRCVR